MNDILMPRGIRNNNPGNIRKSSAHWQGMRDEMFDSAFVEFTDPVFGLRAMMKIFLTYYHKYGLDTVQSIINRWAPPSENATDHYAAHVARKLGVKRYDLLDVPALLVPLAQAVVLHENGAPPRALEKPHYWYADEIYQQARDMALGIRESESGGKQGGFAPQEGLFPVYETKMHDGYGSFL
jgi:hypothetical protein